MKTISAGDSVSVLDTFSVYPVNQGRVISTLNGKVTHLRINESTRYRQEFKGESVNRFVLRPIHKDVV